MCVAAGMQGAVETPMDVAVVHNIIRTYCWNGDSDLGASNSSRR